MPGRTLPLSVPRRLIVDLMALAAATPAVCLERRMVLGKVLEARRAIDPHPSWSALFCKAMAIVAADMPELRQAYMRWPWPHLYEHPTSVAMIAVERDCDGELGVFGCRIVDPASQSIAAITREIRRTAVAPFAEVGRFRRLRRLARLPWAARRLVMAANFHRGRQRSARFGTCALSSVASLGADLLTPRSVWTSLLHYGVMNAEGVLIVRLTFDHRVIDGGRAARALSLLEAALLGPILTELRATPASAIARTETPAGADRPDAPALPHQPARLTRAAARAGRG